jgi:LIVCS family branched-chain amino acid:cation transporter
MILFEGNYRRFFNRIGRIPGMIAIMYCMLIMGPLIAMPRCITVPYEMLYPFFPSYISLTIFSIIFGVLTYILTYSQSQMLDILGKIISPVLLGSLFLILSIGLLQADVMIPQSKATGEVFYDQLVHGFQTLDMIAALFFAYIVLKILKTNKLDAYKPKELVLIGFQGSLIGGAFLAITYLGFSYLGAYYGHIVSADMNGAEIFRNITLTILPHYGVMIIFTAVLMACLSTITALAAVFSEYLYNDVFRHTVSLHTCLVITVTLATLISNFGLTTILTKSIHIINIGYPILSAILFFNLLYKLFDFKPIKIPVLICAIAIIGSYTYQHWL